MGLSAEHVSGDGFGWEQRLSRSGAIELPEQPPATAATRRLPPQSEPLACPRCGSTNTKFCYYNNYNKSQPRHFCKACKRHWTKGGTLRNVPVGGGRKNKRLKISTAAPADVSSTAGTNVVSNNGFNFLGSNLHLLQNQISPFAFSNLISSFESSPISSLPTSFQLLGAYNFIGGLASIEDTTTTAMPTATGFVSDQPWQVPTAVSGCGMGMPSYRNWDDINTMISNELAIPWDETEIKP
ncbi:hypothetical protein U1Q18_010720 [Sarracenia purpurea var. burkii]